MQGTTRVKKKAGSAPGSGRKAGSAPGGGRGNQSLGAGDRPATRVTSGNLSAQPCPSLYATSGGVPPACLSSLGQSFQLCVLSAPLALSVGPPTSARAATAARSLDAGTAGVGRGRVKKRPPSSGPIYQAQLKDSAPADRPNLMIQKLRFCMKCYDFSDDSVEEKSARDAKKVKQMILMEICDYINAKPQILTQEAVVSHLIEMISCNLFNGQRAFVASEPSEEEEPLLDPAYVHTQLVYEILLRFVMNGDTESGMMRRYVNLDFIDKLVCRNALRVVLRPVAALRLQY